MNLVDKNLYYIGGVVRDEILGLPSFDIDFCYEGNAIAFAKELNVVKINPDFGTVRVDIDGVEIDIASTRTETYPKAGHLPLVDNIGCSLIEDLSRRDFTINAMAKNTLTGEITDYFGGLVDIENRKLRVLHNKSFIDDPSRILRGLKFSIRFGFELDDNTKQLQDEYLSSINYDMSYHRIKKELKETFNLNKSEAYEKFVNQKIYKLLNKDVTTPIFIDTIEAERLINLYKPENIWLIYLGCYNLSNFELTSQEKLIIDMYNEIKIKKIESDYDIYKLFKQVPLETILMYALFIDYEIAIKYLEHLSQIKISISGNDLKQLGIPQGKLYGEIFEFLEKTLVLNKNISREEQLDLVKGKYLV